MLGIKLIFVKKRAVPPPKVEDAIAKIGPSILFHVWGGYDYLLVTPFSALNELTAFNNSPLKVAQYLGLPVHQINILVPKTFAIEFISKINFLGIVSVNKRFASNSITSEDISPGDTLRFYRFSQSLGVEDEVILFTGKGDGEEEGKSLADFSAAILKLRQHESKGHPTFTQVSAYVCSGINAGCTPKSSLPAKR